MYFMVLPSFPPYIADYVCCPRRRRSTPTWLHAGRTPAAIAAVTGSRLRQPAAATTLSATSTTPSATRPRSASQAVSRRELNTLGGLIFLEEEDK
jgi:hypothetical protein